MGHSSEHEFVVQINETSRREAFIKICQQVDQLLLLETNLDSESLHTFHQKDSYKWLIK